MSDTKLNGDIAEYAIILKALNKGYGVSKPIGDRLAYDLILDVNGRLLRIQSKLAWFDSTSNVYKVDVRKCKTNRKQYKIENYSSSEFDFAILYIKQLDVFYIMPSTEFCSYKSTITLREGIKFNSNKLKPRSEQNREAWHILSN